MDRIKLVRRLRKLADQLEQPLPPPDEPRFQIAISVLDVSLLGDEGHGKRTVAAFQCIAEPDSTTEYPLPAIVRDGRILIQVRST